MPSRYSDTRGASRALAGLHGQICGRVTVLGIGNRDLGDDAVGSLLAEGLFARTRATVIDAESVPENHLEETVRSRPDFVLLVDAVDFGGRVGEVTLLKPESIAPAGLSTHALTLQMIADYLRARTRAHLLVLGIQPSRVTPWSTLSDEVSQSMRRLLRSLPSVLDKSLTRGSPCRRRRLARPGSSGDRCE